MLCDFVVCEREESVSMKGIRKLDIDQSHHFSPMFLVYVVTLSLSPRHRLCYLLLPHPAECGPDQPPRQEQDVQKRVHPKPAPSHSRVE